MAGQPQIPPVLSFDVTGLEISENPTEWTPSTIVGTTQNFQLAAFFNGSGIVFQWLKNWATEYKVTYYAEGIGLNASEVDLGSKTANLNAGNSYGPPDTALVVPAGTLTEGVYKIACVVTFPGAPGLTGFYDSLMIQVYNE